MKNEELTLTVGEYIDELLLVFKLVSVLSDKNGCRTLRLRSRDGGKDVVLHCFPREYVAYEKLYSVQAENLPIVYDVVTLSDGQAVLEEYIDGVTVAQMMEVEKYTYKSAKKVISGICDALDILHGMGLVHRDVKPENVMVTSKGRVVLIDYNASRQISNVTKDTVIMGSVGYASPEQLGILQSDARTDIYATGVMLNVMLTGKHPSETFASGKAGRVIRKCVNINPDDRFQSAYKLKCSL